MCGSFARLASQLFGRATAIIVAQDDSPAFGRAHLVPDRDLRELPRSPYQIQRSNGGMTANKGITYFLTRLHEESW